MCLCFIVSSSVPSRTQNIFVYSMNKKNDKQKCLARVLLYYFMYMDSRTQYIHLTPPYLSLHPFPYFIPIQPSSLSPTPSQNLPHPTSQTLPHSQPNITPTQNPFTPVQRSGLFDGDTWACPPIGGSDMTDKDRRCHVSLPKRLSNPLFPLPRSGPDSPSYWPSYSNQSARPRPSHN